MLLWPIRNMYLVTKIDVYVYIYIYIHIFIYMMCVCVCVCVCVHAQWCQTLSDPMDCSLPGSSVHGILQARILEWVAISFSKGSLQPKDWTWVPCIAGRFPASESLGKPPVLGSWCRIELNSHIPCWCLRFACWVGSPTHRCWNWVQEPLLVSNKSSSGG